MVCAHSALSHSLFVEVTETSAGGALLQEVQDKARALRLESFVSFPLALSAPGVAETQPQLSLFLSSAMSSLPLWNQNKLP